MRAFILVDLVVICALAYIAANLIRYLFFKSSSTGGLFGLSDMWLKETDDKKGKKK